MEKSATNRKKIWKILILGENITHLTLEREKHGRKLRQFGDYCKFDKLLSRIVANCWVALSQFVVSHSRNSLCRIVAICCIALSQTVASHCHNLLLCIVANCCGVALSQFVALHCRNLLRRIVASRCVMLMRCFVALYKIIIIKINCLFVGNLSTILYIHYRDEQYYIISLIQ